MKVTVYGAGAIGGYLGALLQRAGVEVTLIARGPHLEAMRERGLRVRTAEEELLVHPRVTDDPAEAGEQDYVIVTVKAHSAAARALGEGPSGFSFEANLQMSSGFRPCSVATCSIGLPGRYTGCSRIRGFASSEMFIRCKGT